MDSSLLLNAQICDNRCSKLHNPITLVTVIFLIPISDVSLKNSRADRGDINDPCVRLKRDSVGIMAAFRLKDPCHLIIVANTHIYWYFALSILSAAHLLGCVETGHLIC